MSVRPRCEGVPPAVALALLLLAVASVSVRADDWPQFHHDSRRSGASADRVLTPLAEIWSSSGASTGPVSPVADPTSGRREFAFWHGLAFFVTSRTPPRREGWTPRTLYCLDARTGAVRWRRELGGAGQPIVDSVAGASPYHVAVSKRGTVFVYNALPIPHLDPGDIRRNYDILALRAEDGTPVAMTPLRSDLERPGVPHEPVRRLFLLDVPPFQASDVQSLFGDGIPLPPGTDTYRFLLQANGLQFSVDGTGKANAVVLPNGRAGSEILGSPLASCGMGTPLLVDGTLYAAARGDLLVRWSGGGLAQHLRILHPAPDNWNADFVPQCDLFEYPMAEAPGGLVIGSDHLHRYLAVINAAGGGSALWHVDWPGTLGVPAVEDDSIFVGTGGEDASSEIAAVDARTGAFRWHYGLPGPDPLLGYVGTDWEVRLLGDVPARALFGNRPLPFGLGKGATVPGRGPAPGVAQLEDTIRNATVENPVLSSGRQAVVAHALFDASVKNIGLVATGKRVYGLAGRHLVALDEEAGRPVWEQGVPLGLKVVGLAGAGDRLFVCERSEKEAIAWLVALRMSNGKREWIQPVSGAGGALAVANQILYFTDGEIVRSFAPAERTFRMAVDSPHPEEYLTDEVAHRREQEAEEAQEAADASLLPPIPVALAAPAAGEKSRTGAPPAPAAPKPEPEIADATVLRLRWDEPMETMLSRIAERRKVAPGAPMLLSLDWLDPSRSHPLFQGDAWTPQRAEEFARVCARLAVAAHPAHFNLAPEVNVFLAREPDRVEAVRKLLQAAASAVHAASAGTATLFSVNAEVLHGGYGHGTWKPFGDVPNVTQDQIRAVLELGADVDELGVSSCPDAALTRPEELPGDYFLAIRELARTITGQPKKPLVVTRLTARLRTAKAGYPEQALAVRRLLQLCYWLDAPLVAYPEALSDADAGREALRTPEGDRLALLLWQNALKWKRVPRLSAAPSPPGEEAEDGAVPDAGGK